MSFKTQDAPLLALVACLLGVVLCHTVVSSAHRSGIYRRAQDCVALVRLREPDHFLAVLVGWKISAHAFAAGALVNGVAWCALKMIEG